MLRFTAAPLYWNYIMCGLISSGLYSASLPHLTPVANQFFCTPPETCYCWTQQGQNCTRLLSNTSINDQYCMSNLRPITWLLCLLRWCPQSCCPMILKSYPLSWLGSGQLLLLGEWSREQRRGEADTGTSVSIESWSSITGYQLRCWASCQKMTSRRRAGSMSRLNIQW